MCRSLLTCICQLAAVIAEKLQFLFKIYYSTVSACGGPLCACSVCWRPHSCEDPLKGGARL